MDSTWCIQCNKYCFNYERHLRTTLHYKFTLCPKTGPATCNVCGIMCPNMMSHLETDDHIQAFQRVKQKREEDIIQKFKEKNIISNAKKNEKKNHYFEKRAILLNLPAEPKQLRRVSHCACGSKVFNIQAHFASTKHITWLDGKKNCPELELEPIIQTVETVTKKKKKLNMNCECGRCYSFTPHTKKIHEATNIHQTYLTTGEKWYKKTNAEVRRAYRNTEHGKAVDNAYVRNEEKEKQYAATYYIKHRERILTKRRGEYKELSPEEKEDKKATFKLMYQQNRDRISELNKIRYEKLTEEQKQSAHLKRVARHAKLTPEQRDALADKRSAKYYEKIRLSH